MSKPLVLFLAIAGLIGAGFYAFVRSGGRLRGPAVAMSVEPEKHLVTPAMLAATDAKAKQAAPTFHSIATDGVTYDLAELTARSSVVLVFIKDGCPCSADAQRFYNRLHETYGREVRFLGVIDADPNGGRAWGQRNRTAFPLLADPDLAIASRFGAESSAYMAVVERGGAIDHLYPGYSREMLAEASGRIARLAGVPPASIDATGAPEELSTGCPLAGPGAD
jgi:peroxiredoxin